MRVALVSHCDFDGNSAFHVLAVARELKSPVELANESPDALPEKRTRALAGETT